MQKAAINATNHGCITIQRTTNAALAICHGVIPADGTLHQRVALTDLFLRCSRKVAAPVMGASLPEVSSSYFGSGGMTPARMAMTTPCTARMAANRTPDQGKPRRCLAAPPTRGPPPPPLWYEPMRMPDTRSSIPSWSKPCRTEYQASTCSNPALQASNHSLLSGSRGQAKHTLLQ